MRRRFADEYEKEVIIPYYRDCGRKETMEKFNMKYDSVLYPILKRHNEPLKGNGYNNLDEIEVIKYYSGHGMTPTMIKFNIRTKPTLYNILRRNKTPLKGFTPKNHRNWKGGITSETDREYEKIRRRKKYQEIREKVLQRDNYKCQVSGNKDIELHHIYPVRSFPKRVYDINNIITISKHFHNKIKKHEEDYIDYLSQLQTDRGLPL